MSTVSLMPSFFSAGTQTLSLRYLNVSLPTARGDLPSVSPQAVKITWKDDAHNLTKAFPQVFDDDDLSELGSFFNLFEVGKDHADVSRISSQ